MGQKKKRRDRKASEEKILKFYRQLYSLSEEFSRLLGDILWEIDLSTDEEEMLLLKEITKVIVTTTRRLFEDSLDVWAEANPEHVDRAGEELGLPSTENTVNIFYYSNN